MAANTNPLGQGLVVTSSRIRGMREMCMNILMEAEEKCEEIDVKCEEEYRYLKMKEIILQRGKVKEIVHKRKHEVEREFRVFMTKLVNQSRLAHLQAKNDVVKQIKEEVKNRLSKQKGPEYKILLKNSMIQALFMLMEPEVRVACRKKERELVSSCFREVSAVYESKTQLRIQIVLDNETLPDKNIGGVIVSDMTRDVSIDCQLDSRVEQVCRRAMPLIVELLFGDVKPSDHHPSSEGFELKGRSSTKSNLDLKRNERSQVPLRDQGGSTSKIALPTRSVSTSSQSPSHSPSHSPPPGLTEKKSATLPPGDKKR